MKVAVAAAVLGCVTQMMAVNITIQDYNGPGGSVYTSKLWGFNGGPYGTGAEDNETEYNSTRSQAWDLEAYSIIGSTLYMIGGYDFESGIGSSGRPGDLFIKIGGAAGYTPTGSASTVKNGDYYDYNYAVRLTGSLAGSSVNVQPLLGSSRLKTVDNDYMGSNPWKYYGSGTTPDPNTFATEIVYYEDLTATQVGDLTGVTDLRGDSGWHPNQSHNVLAIDLGFLSDISAGTEVYFSYTMECGNDMMKGSYDGGFRTPDGGATLMLLGMCLSALGVAARKLRVA